MTSRCVKPCWKKLSVLKQSLIGYWSFNLKNPPRKLKFSTFFPAKFCALFHDIAQSCLNCACTQEYHGRIFSLLGFLSWMENGISYIYVRNSRRAIVKPLFIEKHVKTVKNMITFYKARKSIEADVCTNERIYSQDSEF